MSEHVESDFDRFTPPWFFAVLELPFGAAIGYLEYAAPYLLRGEHGEGLPLSEIALLSATAFSMHTWKIAWVPLIDFASKRRTWYIGSTLAVAAFLLGASLIPDPQNHIGLFRLLMLGAQGGAATCSAALEALMATTVRPERKARAGSFFMAGNLGGTGVLGALAIWLPKHAGPHVAGWVLGGIVLVSSAPVLAIVERPHYSDAVQKAGSLGRAVWLRVKEIVIDLWRTVASKRGITGLLICLAPVGCGALTNLFSGMAVDYRAPESVVELIAGVAVGVVGGIAAALSPLVLERLNARLTYALAGGLTALAALAMALAPMTAATYSWGTLLYGFFNGFAFAAFSAIVLEMVTHGAGVTTSYTLFVAASNLAINATTALDGQAFGLKRFGTRGIIFFDAAITAVGIVFLLAMVALTRRFERPSPAASA